MGPHKAQSSQMKYTSPLEGYDMNKVNIVLSGYTPANYQQIITDDISLSLPFLTAGLVSIL